MRAAVQAVARAVGGVDPRPDGDLVAAFLGADGRPAFDALVRRHGPMVLAVCRRTLGHAHDAEDAAQAAFLVLARKAGSIRREASVAAWLHGVAVRVARKARDRACRQTRREYAAARPEAVTSDDPSWAEVRGVLDAELAALPDRFRQPLVLCYLQGLTRDEAAKALGWSPATLGRRLEAAREALGRRLRARGVAGAAALPAVLVSDAAAGGTFPSELVAACVDHALGVTGRSGVMIPAAVAELSRGVAQTMTRTVLLGAVGVVLAAAGVYAALPADPPKPADRPPEKKPFDFDHASVTADDVVNAYSLDVFKYTVEIPKGQRFDVVWRELDDKDAAPRVLKRFPFRRVKDDGSTTIRVDFLRTDGVVGGVLLSDQENAVFKVYCSGCDLPMMGSVVPLLQLPLAQRTKMGHNTESNERVGEKSLVLLSVFCNVEGQGHYPRAELVIEPR